MEDTLYNDIIPSQETIKKLHKGKINKFDYVEDLIFDGQIIDYFACFFDDLYEIFKNEHYAPQTLDDANFYLMKVYYDLDKVSEVAGVYTKKINGKEKEFITSIHQNDFYKAYYMPIWKNLGLKERAQILKWHFEYKKELLDCKNLKLRLIEHEDYFRCGQTMGMFMSLEKTMYINNRLLFYSNPFDLITTIEHEFQHVNQESCDLYFKRKKKQKYSLYEKIIMGKWSLQNYPAKFQTTEKEKESLYLGYMMEQKAEGRALKGFEKINRANQKIFGKCAEQEKCNKESIWDMKFRNGLLTVGQVAKSGKYDDKQIEEYAKRRKIMKNCDYFSKLYLLWRYNYNKLSKLEKEYDDALEIKNEQEKQEKLDSLMEQKEECVKTYKKLEKNYKDVLRNNGKHLPKSEFEKLNLEE